MIELRNRGKYPKPVEEDLQNIADTTAFFLTQIFDADGNFIRPEQRSVVKFTYYNDLSINNGFSTGASILPQAVDVSKTLLINLGVLGASSAQITLESSTLVRGTRTGTSGDANVRYCLMEFQ